MDLSLIVWLPPFVAAILGVSMGFPKDHGLNDRPTRTCHRLSAWLGMGALIVTLGGLWTWVAAFEQGQLLATVVFLVGSAYAVVGFQLLRGTTSRRKER